jgi:hypothetical protein
MELQTQVWAKLIVIKTLILYKINIMLFFSLALDDFLYIIRGRSHLLSVGHQPQPIYRNPDPKTQLSDHNENTQ